MEQKKRAWLYCRIDAPEDSHGSLKGQQERLDNYAQQMGFEVVGSSRDMGKASNFDCPGISEMMSAAQGKQMDVLLLESSSRLGRDLYQTAELIGQLQKRGITIFSPLEGEITTAPHDCVRSLLFD